MKRLTLLLLFALPLFASEDSPLVAAAKRNGRAKMPKKVITNETVKTSKGRVTTTTAQPPIDLAALAAPSAKPTVAGKAQQTQPLTQAAEDKRASDKRQRRKARAAAAAEEDPAVAEHASQVAEQKPR